MNKLELSMHISRFLHNKATAGYMGSHGELFRTKLGKHMGVCRGTVSRMLNGGTDWSLYRLLIVFEVFGTSLREFTDYLETVHLNHQANQHFGLDNDDMIIKGNLLMEGDDENN